MAQHTPEEHAELYGQLRAQVLGRFFAYNRYFRSNHLSIENHLGLVCHSNTPTVPDKDDVAVDCSNRQEVRPSAYADANTLAGLIFDKQEYERWRVAQHTADNPLMFSSQLLVALAVENKLQRAGALPALRLAIDGLGAMYKFGNIGGYEGYPIRHDAVSSDLWVTRDQNGESVPWYCCQFLLDEDFNHLFCTPFTHPGYVPYDPTEFYAEDPEHPGNWRTYSGNDDWPPRKDSLQSYRSWEPSMDELAGLIPAYDFVFFLVSDPLIRAEIQRQVNNLSRYLSAHGYVLVRPGGGFAARGGSGILPALEYPFSRVFARITGQPAPPAASFEQAMIDGGVWDAIRPSMQRWGIAGAAILGGILSATAYFFGSFLSNPIAVLAAAAGSVLGAAGGYFVGRAYGVFVRRDSFDVWNEDQRREFSYCYLLKQLSYKFRFTTWMSNIGLGKYARNFPQFIGLAGIADTTDTTVKDAFLGALPGARSDARGTWGNTGFASAVAVTLGQTSEEANLRKFLDDAFDCLTGNCPSGTNGTGRNRTPMLDDESPIVVERIRNTLPSSTKEDPMNPLEYMACLALNWLRAKQLTDAGMTVGSDLLSFPPATPPWPAVTVPAQVVADGIVPALDPLAGQGPVLAFPVDDSFPPRVDSRPPDVPPAPPPIVQIDTFNVNIPESQMLIDPNIEIRSNDQVSIQATGTIWAGVWLSGRNGPNGWSEITTDHNYPRPGTNRFCLLYKIVPIGGNFGVLPWQKLGTSLSFAAVSPDLCGNLYLRTNDDVVGNGNGEFTCAITIKRA